MRDRLLEAVGIQTEPEHVEKASPRERWKRQTWLFTSLLISWIPVGILADALIDWIGWHPRGAASVWPVLLFVALVVVVNIKVHSWGVERFDLVVPWQFREERAKERENS
jgi:hypothetical protein